MIESRQLSAASDVYSLGIALWELVNAPAEPFARVHRSDDLCCVLCDADAVSQPVPLNFAHFARYSAFQEIVQKMCSYKTTERPCINAALNELTALFVQLQESSSELAYGGGDTDYAASFESN